MSNDFTSVEIRTQAEAWRNARQVVEQHQAEVKAHWDGGAFDAILFVGCGSTHYLSLAAASLTQALTGIPARGLPASELLLHPDSVYTPQGRPLLVTVSRSAETTETIRAARLYRQRYGEEVLNISCYGDRPLNAEAALNLVAPAGQEQSIAQTRSFSAMLVMAEGVARLLSGAPYDPAWLPVAQGDEYVLQAEAFAANYADPERYDRYFYLGSGPRYGLACEAMLKMKEMSQTYAEAYHPFEFRHGPKSMVNDRTVVVGLLGETGYDEERTVLAEMRALGATTLALGPHPDSDFRLLTGESGSAPLVGYVPVCQWMAYARAIHKALNPDHPHNLDMVVHL